MVTGYWCKSWHLFCLILGRPLLILGMSEKTLWCNSNLCLCWHYSHFFSPCWLFGLNEEVLYGSMAVGSGCAERLCRTSWVWVLFTKECEWVTKVSQLPALLIVMVLGSWQSGISNAAWYRCPYPSRSVPFMLLLSRDLGMTACSWMISLSFLSDREEGSSLHQKAGSSRSQVLLALIVIFLMRIYLF